MHHPRESALRRLFAAPEFDDPATASIARATFVVAWTLLLAITPLSLILALLFPQIARVAIAMIGALDFVALVAVGLVRAGKVAVASLVFSAASWVVFSQAAWYTGGLQSAAVGGLFVVVVMIGLVHGWEWGVPAAFAGVATVLLLASAENAGWLPTPHFTYTPIAHASAYALYLLALGVLLTTSSISLRRSQHRSKRAAGERQFTEQRLLDVIDAAPFGALVCSLDRHHDQLCVVHVNRAASDVLGIDANRFVGKPIDRAFAALSSSEWLAKFQQIAHDGGRHHAESVPFYAEGRSGTLEMHAFQVSDDSMAVFFVDVTERRREQVQIHRMAFHDELTKLPNRKLLADRLEVSLAASHRRRTEVALLFIDLDNFKSLNDRFGHTMGDELLVGVADRLRTVARASDTVARYGGDEFCVLVPDILEREQAETVAKKLVAALAEPFELSGRRLSVTASIGVAMTDDDDRSAESLIERADSAMYRAKRAGRNGYRVL
ncbi:MAG: diguanylate cyclase [Coriobacteriia bacterium]|nr:diguanylate cyclase [Coriobacteriia bacterium]